jgi:anti-sigma regulatory factor (Ser/Thr protein kinase)
VDLDGRDLPVLRDESALRIAFAFPAGDPLHVSCVRPWLNSVLAARWGNDADVGLLAVHEVLANSAVHGTGTVRAALVIGNWELVADVWDESSLKPLRGEPGTNAESGRGLLLIDQLGGRLTSDLSAGGKVVRLWLSRRPSAPDNDPLARWGNDGD